MQSASERECPCRVRETVIKNTWLKRFSNVSNLMSI
ncbi:unnamed protein product [Coffea canephora]|uniref:Uncharacterized protein n=1 Tax=Coffea canephora TaxID=49390 RepID=A0A068V4J9_COFCA|nr:unnamed protein product [Coffea canephora]